MRFDTTFIDEMEAAFAKLDEERKQEETFRQAVLGAAVVLTLVLFYWPLDGGVFSGAEGSCYP